MSGIYKNRPKSKKKQWTFMDYCAWAIFIISILFYPINITCYYVENALLKNYGKRTKVVVTNLEDSSGRYHRPRLLYEFMFEGEYYYGNSLIEKTRKIELAIALILFILIFGLQ